ncbi:MAG: hypothetical protein AAF525_09675 [Pseudomonadota bacterium]
MVRVHFPAPLYSANQLRFIAASDNGGDGGAFQANQSEMILAVAVQSPELYILLGAS